MEILSSLITIFITFFTVIDPIGTVPVFIAVTASVRKEDKATIANRAALVSTGVLIFFVVAGELILNAIGVPLSTFQIAGGIVLFLFALTMIFGESKPEEEIESAKGRASNVDKAIFPLAMPSLASPGAILAAILLTDNSKNHIEDQVITTLVMISVIFVAWLLMRFSSYLFKYIGMAGAAIISRVMGMILTSVAVVHILQGISTYFGL